MNCKATYLSVVSNHLSHWAACHRHGEDGILSDTIRCKFAEPHIRCLNEVYMLREILDLKRVRLGKSTHLFGSAGLVEARVAAVEDVLA